jgi:3-hydroxyisobutyrate dehydrogenase-like beta-hydroxyacid dehydrogenase
MADTNDFNGATQSAAFIGLGTMGYPMAGWLARNGIAVSVFNRTRSKALEWGAEFAGTVAETPAAAAAGARVVFTCVGDDPDVEQVVLGPRGVLAGLGRGGILVDHTTGSADLARRLAQLAARQGVSVLDAPVSGGQAGAQAGSLTVMVGGDAAAFAQAEPLMAHYARSVRHMGPSGSGQLTKMVNQICIAGLLQGLSEGLRFAQRAGLDPNEVLAVIAKGAAQSWQMENRWPTMARDEFDFGFAVEWMQKDLRICLEQAHANGSQLPVTALVAQFYDEVAAAGGARWDTSSLITRLSR